METESHDAYPPAEIARRVERIGVAKARTDTITLLALAVLAGAFISMGALFFTVATTGSTLGLGPTRLVGGLAFCLGLVLVVVAGAELFTGNILIAMAWACGDVGTREVVRNWLIAYAGNVAGCLGSVVLVLGCGTAALGGGAVGETAIAIARAKAELPASDAFFRGVLCNALVCLAVWLTIGARSVTDKILAVLFPIAGFVTVGFEHSIANWFFLPWGMALAPTGTVSGAAVATNLAAVTAGNIIGGTLLVAAVYWVAYLRGERMRGGASPR
ncbi:MAG: formate/nitrite transporter family protein [Burkholderiales bacterium]